jgi:hypothetical protein
LPGLKNWKLRNTPPGFSFYPVHPLILSIMFKPLHDQKGNLRDRPFTGQGKAIYGTGQFFNNAVETLPTFFPHEKSRVTLHRHFFPVKNLRGDSPTIFPHEKTSADTPQRFFPYEKPL